MIEAAEAVGAFIAARHRADLDADRLLLFALVRAVEIIGEAAPRLLPETRAGAPAVPWAEITGMRNRLGALIALAERAGLAVEVRIGLATARLGLVAHARRQTCGRTHYTIPGPPAPDVAADRNPPPRYCRTLPEVPRPS